MVTLMDERTPSAGAWIETPQGAIVDLDDIVRFFQMSSAPYPNMIYPLEVWSNGTDGREDG